MNRSLLTASLLTLPLVAAACGGGSKKPVEKPEETPTDKPDPTPPPPPPPCVKAGDAAVWGAWALDDKLTFCTGERGSSSPDCFDVDLASGEYTKSNRAAIIAPGSTTVTTTPTEVTVCQGPAAPAPAADGSAPPDGATAPVAEPLCTTLKPKVAKDAADQLVATANDKYAVIINGAVAEVWDAVKAKKLKDIKFQKGDYKCATPYLVGEQLILSAKTCDGPSARASLWTAKTGKAIGAGFIGGKNFGTYSEAGLQFAQVGGLDYAFLEEFGAQLAVQDLGKGKVHRQIDLAGLWSIGAATDAGAADAGAEGAAAVAAGAEPAAMPADGGAAAAIGNPGASLLVSVAPGKLAVVSGGPTPGNIAVVDANTGETKILPAPVCK
jgi:hypothetical protein